MHQRFVIQSKNTKHGYLSHRIGGWQPDNSNRYNWVPIQYARILLRKSDAESLARTHNGIVKTVSVSIEDI